MPRLYSTASSKVPTPYIHQHLTAVLSQQTVSNKCVGSVKYGLYKMLPVDANLLLHWDMCSLGKCALHPLCLQLVQISDSNPFSLALFSSLSFLLFFSKENSQWLYFSSLASFYPPKRYFRKPKIQGPTLALEIKWVIINAPLYSFIIISLTHLWLTHFFT